MRNHCLLLHPARTTATGTTFRRKHAELTQQHADSNGTTKRICYRYGIPAYGEDERLPLADTIDDVATESEHPFVGDELCADVANRWKNHFYALLGEQPKCTGWRRGFHSHTGIRIAGYR